MGIMNYVNKLEHEIARMQKEGGLTDMRVTWGEALESVTDVEVKAKALLDFVNAKTVEDCDGLDWSGGDSILNRSADGWED